MKKRLLAWVVVVALFAGFGQGLMQAKPAAAQSPSCNPGYTEVMTTPNSPVTSAGGALKSTAWLGFRYCSNGLSAYALEGWLYTSDYDNWHFDGYSYSVTNQGLHLEAIYAARWDKYNNEGEIKGQACVTFRIKGYLSGYTTFDIIFYDTDC